MIVARMCGAAVVTAAPLEADVPPWRTRRVRLDRKERIV